jgi:predicted transposase YdaD
MGERYMLFEELLKDEFSAGKKEGRAEGREEGRTEGVVQSMMCILSEKGTVSEELCAKLRSCSDMEQLLALVNFATKAESVSAFEAELDNLLK